MYARLLWYGNRLAAMSPAELAHRLVEQGKRRLSGRRGWRWPKEGDLPAMPGCRERVQALPAQAFPTAEAEQVFAAGRRGDYTFLGRSWPTCGADPQRWHLDPVTGRHWPADAYCFAIPFRHTTEFGDVKYVWELNRLQHLQAVAALAARDDNEAAAAFCRQEIASWIAANPPFRGVNWASGIELALRTVSLLVVTGCLGQQAFPAHERENLIATLAAHGYWMHRFPSRFSSANNHLVAEAGALYVLGMLAPDLPGAREWAGYGRRTLIEEIGRQVHPDGVGAEQSPTYTAFSLEWWLMAAAVAQAAGEPFPEAYRQRIEKAADFLRLILDDADRHPRIGDDDEGRVIVALGPAEDYVATVVDAVAAFSNRPDLRPCRDYPHFWQAFFPSLTARRPRPAGIATFSSGGYSVVREPMGGQNLLLVFDHGPLGYLSIAAHGHADALAVWLHLDGQPVLVDAGTYLYHSGGRWRDHFRGTAAHNTLMVAGSDSSRIAGPFNWSRKAGTTLLAADSSPGAWRFEAEHDGFVATAGVRHRRAVEREGDAGVAIVDHLVGGNASHDVEAGFLVHPDLDVDENGDAFMIRRGALPLLRIRHEGPLDGRCERGREDPMRGWYSPAFGSRRPATRIVFSGRLAPHNSCRYILEIAPSSPD